VINWISDDSTIGVGQFYRPAQPKIPSLMTWKFVVVNPIFVESSPLYFPEVGNALYSYVINWLSGIKLSPDYYGQVRVRIYRLSSTGFWKDREGENCFTVNPITRIAPCPMELPLPPE